MHADVAVIVANGDFSATASQLEGIRQSKLLIAVDGGIEHCIHAKLRPHLLLGDFDSISPPSLAFFSDVPRVTLPHDKDESDLEVAIQHALAHSEGPIGVFGALGKRTDHLLYNLYLLARYPGRVTLESEKERLFVIRDKHTLIARPGQTISLLPLNGVVKGVSTRGLQWELEDATFDKQWMSLSNVCVGKIVEITLDQGDLLCCIENTKL
jgi:thiamine pyrophosphokinase